jgi:subtilisin family serine protease
MDKVDLHLAAVLEQRDRADAEAVARGHPDAAVLADSPIDVRVAFEGPFDPIAEAGFPLHSFVAGVARGGLSPAQIRKLVALPQVLFVSIPHVASPLLDISVPEIHGVDAWGVGIGTTDVARGKGAGVIVGIVDSGIDIFHGAFRKPDGKTRILSLWDQTFLYNPAGAPVDSIGGALTGDLQPKDETGAVLTPARSPSRLGAAFRYGGEFNSSQIDAALAAHPDGKNLPVSLRDQPKVSGDTVVHHGTHVAGIAAGNGAQNDKCTKPFTYIGVAPQADLVIVKTSIGVQPNTVQRLADAVQYIFAIAAVPPSGSAAGRPCVVNLSLGGHYGPHNGQDDDARAFDTSTTGVLSIGRAIVIAAGNDRAVDLHAAFTVVQGTTQTVRVNLTAKTVTRFVLSGSYNPAANLSCVVRLPPSGAVVQSPQRAVNVDAQSLVGAYNVHVGPIHSGPTDQDSHFFVDIALPPPAPPPAGAHVTEGVWEFDFVVGPGADANVHLWVATPGAYSAYILPFAGAVASVQDALRPVKRPEAWIGATLTGLATSRRAITVAAYNAEEAGTPLAVFSSQGPAPNQLSLGLYDPNGVIAKPDIAAPGVAIDAPRAEARKCCLECNCCVDRYVAEEGTSMAAPHITGVVALMFAQNPLLTSDEIKARLRASSRNPPAFPPGWPALAEFWGAGKVDARAAALAAVREKAPDAAIDVPPVESSSRAPARPSLIDRLRRWNEILGPHPSWNLCAALLSLHFDEVKRLIDTNRRVGAVWQRHGGPALVRGIVFAEGPPDPPVPAGFASGPAPELMRKLLALLMRYGGNTLRADLVRYSGFMLALPGASWDELDTLVQSGSPR